MNPGARKAPSTSTTTASDGVSASAGNTSVITPLAKASVTPAPPGNRPPTTKVRDSVASGGVSGRCATSVRKGSSRSTRPSAKPRPVLGSEPASDSRLEPSLRAGLGAEVAAEPPEHPTARGRSTTQRKRRDTLGRRRLRWLMGAGSIVRTMLRGTRTLGNWITTYWAGGLASFLCKIIKALITVSSDKRSSHVNLSCVPGSYSFVASQASPSQNVFRLSLENT